MALSMTARAAWQTNGGWDFRIVEDGIERGEGEIEPFLAAVADEKGAVILCVGEGFAKEGRVASPVGDGVAVNAGLGRGVSRVHALCQGGDDYELFGCESFVKHKRERLASA